MSIPVGAAMRTTDGRRLQPAAVTVWASLPPMARLHAFTDDALGDLDAVGITEALAAGRVSIPEVVEAAIARTERVGPVLNAVAVECFDRARAEAADPRGGFFAGVPTFLKDNVDLAGLPTMQGTDAFDPRPAKRDGDFARMFLATGLVPIGKTQLSEYGFSASAEHARLGAVRSPWSTDHTAGASSAGTGALVAAGAVPLAHGNDGGGSIRIPAAVNGLVGLKPTRGRLAQDRPLRQMPVRIVSDGVLTRSVRDTAAFLREAERVYRDLRLAPVGDVRGPGRARRTVAVVTEGIDVSATPEVDRLTRQTAGLLESLGHRVEWIEQPMPASFKDDFLLYWSSLASVITATGRMEHGRSWDPTKLDLFTQGLDRHCRRNLRHLPGATDPAAPVRTAGGGPARSVRRRAHPDARARDPGARLAGPGPGLRHRDGPAPRVGRVHPVAERHRRPCRLAPAGHHGRRSPPGDDARRRSRRRGDAARAGLRAGGGPPLAAPPRRLTHSRGGSRRLTRPDE